ncbi:hypothetical protein ABI59_21310 [Acidobacteria bacterium Mor1]|nr:hypothetical protein ABI59_21310 [Acidobacteria bacterium Mor1]
MHRPTADICDAHEASVQVCDPLFGDFGGRLEFEGPIVTVETFEDNSSVRPILEEDGKGRVLVIDGAGSTRCALVGGNIATLAAERGWAGIVIHGCVRDAHELDEVPVGIKALALAPRRSEKRGRGTRDVPVSFAGVRFEPGQYLFADRDGIVVLPERPAD